jgi:hypothetical protein
VRGKAREAAKVMGKGKVRETGLGTATGMQRVMTMAVARLGATAG